LFDQHRRELEIDSAIHPDVIAERGYESIHRPTNVDQRQRNRLNSLRIPTWATGADSYFAGILIPMYGPTGQRASYQWKPRRPVPKRDGKKMKYASPKGQTNRLDVHPRNRSKIADPTVELWITEGIKKADSLTSRGLCVIALTGVFNWRSGLGTRGDWEDVPLKGRVATICFDADSRKLTGCSSVNQTGFQTSSTATSSTHPREVCRPSKDNRAPAREPGMSQTNQAIALLF
jgi:hypothetical protein